MCEAMRAPLQKRALDSKLVVMLTAHPLAEIFLWAAATVPLFVLLAATAIKEGVEDFFRHREDDAVNSRQATCLYEQTELSAAERHPDAFEVRVPWKRLRVGQIVKVCIKSSYAGHATSVNQLCELIVRTSRSLAALSCWRLAAHKI